MSDQSKTDQARDKLAQAVEQARMKVSEKRPDGFTVTIDGQPYHVSVASGAPGGGGHTETPEQYGAQH